MKKKTANLSSYHIRAFVAIELPDTAKVFLEDVITVLKQSRADVRWTKPASIHITLKFLGNIDVSIISAIGNQLEPIFSVQEPFDLTISGLGVFPDQRRPRVIWAGLSDNLGYLSKMAEKVDRALIDLGFEHETRPYRPHLTIGRMRSSEGRERLMDMVNNQECSGPMFRVNRSVLFQSELGPTGSRYTPLAIFNFAKSLLTEPMKS